MIVCLCEGLSDRHLRRAIADGSGSVRDLAQATRAGTHCGSCACDLRRMIEEHRDTAEVPITAAAPGALLRR